MSPAEDRFDVQPNVSNHFAWMRTQLALQRTMLAAVRTAERAWPRCDRSRAAASAGSAGSSARQRRPSTTIHRPSSVRLVSRIRRQRRSTGMRLAFAGTGSSATRTVSMPSS